MPRTGNSESPSPASQDPLRAKLVDAAREGWINRLIDLSRRNNLLYYRQTASSSLDLPVTPALMSFLSGGETLTVGDLMPVYREKVGSIRALARKGLENLEEKGLSTLYLALGRCTWTASDGGRDPVAPVFLIPVALKLKGQDPDATEIHVTGHPEVNPVLLHIFNRELNIPSRAEDLLNRFIHDSTDGDDAATMEFEPVLQYLGGITNKLPGFKAEICAVLGNFSFQKLAMVRDLDNHRAELIENSVVAAIAGDEGARRTLGGSHIHTDPRTLDIVLPRNEFAVLEADSSQQCAIIGVVAGQSAVVHGPPGTGKSQTITNLIATLTAQGKKVLFVAEKRAALAVVMDRLVAVGLDHLAIDLHGAEQTPKKVMERIARTLTMVREAPNPVSDNVHDQFVDRRNKLNAHDAKMHTPYPPTQQTLYAMQGALLRIPTNIVSRLRWRGPDLMQLTPKAAERVLDLLTEAAGFETLFHRSDPSPWTGVELRGGQAVEEAIDLADRLHHKVLPDLRASLAEVCGAAGFRPPASMAESLEILSVLKQAEQTLTTYEAKVFIEADQLLRQMLPCRAGGIRGIWLRTTNRFYRAAYKTATHLRRGKKVSSTMVVRELSEAARTRQQWAQLSGSGMLPKLVPALGICDQNHQKAEADLRRLESICKANLQPEPLTAIATRVAALSADNNTPHRLRSLFEIEQQLYTLGVQRLVDEIRLTRRPAAQWQDLFRHVWLNSTVDSAAVQNPDVKGFVGATHKTYVDDFKRLDSARLRLAADRVRRAHAERTIAAMNEFPEQEALIRGEAAKSRRHKPLRKIFGDAREVMTAVCPCWMASPLSVCQLIAATNVFDYVIFDEASQVLPEDAIPSILRGKHVIVAGDSKQLPPTTFFAAADEEEDTDGDASAYESLLDMMIPFVKGFHLNWHYRSRDESLITFSNHHIYDGRLVTFPGTGGANAISHVLADKVAARDGQEESADGEVNKVVELVLHHAQTKSGRTLGVITMGIKHADRIQAALDREMVRYPQLAEFFDTARPERFFIKNLERVQGDERDVIILSVGYAKDRAGNLPLRFGPILSAAGRRRLNVAVTRAKEQMIVVSSFAYSDIESGKVRPGTGLEFLKNYLQYASSGGTILSLDELTGEPMNDFEADVYEVLSAKGMALTPQVGSSSFRIDLAATHPNRPGEFVLAIECDGASYHSSYTARDRDRLRQQQLENLGWTFHRIWSTDWFMRRHEEVERAVQAFHRAVAESDSPGPRNAPKSNNEPSAEPMLAKEAASDRIPVRAPIQARSSIEEYSFEELLNLLQWVQSDGRLRTHDEIIEEMFAQLPFKRRGSKIDAALRNTVERWEWIKNK